MSPVVRSAVTPATPPAAPLVNASGEARGQDGPPVLLELSGPMFMSYPALNHVEVRLDQIAGGTKVTLRHRAIGLLDSMHRENVGAGWRHYLDSIAQDFANGVAAHRA